MTNFQGSPAVIGNQRMHGFFPTVVVVQDVGSHGEQPLEDAGDQVGRRVPAGYVEIERTLKHIVDRLDDLAEWLEEPDTGQWPSSGVDRAYQGDTPLGEKSFEPNRGTAFVGKDALAAINEVRLKLEEALDHLELVDLGFGQCRGGGQASWSTHQVQAHFKEVTRPADAEAIVDETSQIAALRAGAGAPGLDGGRMNDRGVAAKVVGVGCEYPDQDVQLPLGPPLLLVAARVAGHIREAMSAGTWPNSARSGPTSRAKPNRSWTMPMVTTRRYSTSKRCPSLVARGEAMEYTSRFRRLSRTVR